MERVKSENNSNVEWEYYFENLYEEKDMSLEVSPVAVLYYKGIRTLDIYQASSGYLSTISCESRYDDITSIVVTSSKIHEFCNEKNAANADNSQNMLIVGCKLIEEDFLEQIRKIIGNGLTQDSMEIELAKALIELSPTSEEADAIITNYIPSATLEEKITYLCELFDCEVIDRKSDDPDELIYKLLLEAIIAAKYVS